MAMDALQGKVDSVDNQFRQIATELRGYLDHGITGTRKVKPPGTKAGRELLQHILGRIDQIVSTDLADARRLSISSTTSTPIPQQRAISETGTASSYALPSAASQSHRQSVPQDGPSPQPQQQHQPTPPSFTPVATAPQDKLGEDNESLKQSLSHASQLSPTAVKLKADLITPVTPITPGRGPTGVVPVAGQDALACQVLAGPQTAPTPVLPPLRFTQFEHSAPLFDCTYQDIHVLNEDLFEQCSSHPVVRDRGYFKLQVSNLPPLNVESMERPTRDHAQSFRYKIDQYGLIKVDTGKKPKFSEPRLPFPSSAKLNWTFEEQRELWNSTAKNPPKGHRPYIIGNPLFEDIDLSPGEKLRQRGKGVLEGINTQYVYFNLTGKTITTMHREDAHVRSENILRSGENKFWCFVKPGSTAKLEEAMHRAYPEMRNCSQAVRHLSRHIPPAQLEEWGVEYTLDYCIPGQAVVTEPGTYHQVLNLGPNYAIAINLEYMSSPDDPPDYVFCDKACPDKFSISAEDFQIHRPPTPPEEEPTEKTKPERSHTTHAKRRGPVSRKGYSADQEQGSTGESTNESTPSQEDFNASQQQRNSTELAPGPTPTLTPERENAETSFQEEPANQPQAMPQATVDPGPRSLGTPQFTETAPCAIAPQPESPLSEHIDQAPEKAQMAPQPEALPPSTSNKFLAKEIPLFTPAQIQHPKSPYQTQVLEQPTPSTLPQLQPQPQPQPTISAVYSTPQNVPNPPIQVPESTLHYTPNLLLPKQAAEQLPVKVRERCENETPPPALPQRFPSAVTQLPFPPQYQNIPVSTIHPGSPGAHTLLEFSLRPTPPVDPVSCEPINAYRAASEVSNMESAGKRRKRQGELPSNKKSQKRQKPEPVVAPIVQPIPQPIAQPVAQSIVQPMPVAVDYSHRSAFNHLATLIRGYVVAQADALETAQVCSKVSFERLAGLVQDYRWYSRMYPFIGGGIHLVNHVENGFQGSHALRVYLSRFSKMKLVDWIERAVGESGPHVASEVHTDRLLSELGWTESDRHKLHDYLREGKCWKAICGTFEGVLCLMAPDIPDTQFTELALYQSRIATFHSQLDIPFVRKLCDMGKILEKAIWSDLELPEFIWEAVDTDYLSLNEVFSLLGRFRSIRQNQFHRDKYPWSRPLCWDWNWPADPTSLSPRDKRFCGHCNITAAKGTKTPCHCFEIHVPSIPRISDDGSKGNGIRALGSYKAGSLLGELVGELVPLGTYRSTADWTIQFRRPDLEDHPVAEIYTRDVGNWVRKVNHCSTQPSAAFKVMKISGKWRQMLVALRDIKDGEEITAKYGRGYCKEQPYSQVEGFL